MSVKRGWVYRFVIRKWIFTYLKYKKNEGKEISERDCYNI